MLKPAVLRATLGLACWAVAIWALALSFEALQQAPVAPIARASAPAHSARVVSPQAAGALAERTVASSDSTPLPGRAVGREDAPALDEPAPLRGRVLDACTLEPLAGVLVSFKEGGSKRSVYRTEADGRFRALRGHDPDLTGIELSDSEHEVPLPEDGGRRELIAGEWTFFVLPTFSFVNASRIDPRAKAAVARLLGTDDRGATLRGAWCPAQRDGKVWTVRFSTIGPRLKRALALEVFVSSHPLLESAAGVQTVSYRDDLGPPALTEAVAYAGSVTIQSTVGLQRRPLRVQLTALPLVHGRIVDSRGRPAPRASFRVEPLDRDALRTPDPSWLSREISGVVGRDGVLVLFPLAPGRYRLLVQGAARAGVEDALMPDPLEREADSGERQFTLGAATLDLGLLPL